MKRAILRVALGAISLVFFAQGAVQGASLPGRPEELPKAAPVVFSPPTLLRESLPNGVGLILLPDHTLPLVKLYALVKAGNIYESPGKLGVAELTGASLKAGGTKSYPADKMLETLEALAAELNTSVGQESGTVSMNLLSKDMKVGLPIFADVLARPAFAPDKVAVEKAKMMEEIRRQNEEPWQVGGREMAKTLYGADSPWARTATLASVEALTPADLQAFHGRFFKPQGTIIAVAGDFDPAALKAQLTILFKGWEGKAEYPEVAPAPAEERAGVVLMDRPDLTQSTVYVGLLTAKRGRGETFNTDRYAMDVMNFILGGGGFTSILTREIRSNRGLAYTAGSYYGFGTDRGQFAAYCQTGLATTGQVCGLIKDALGEVTQKAPADTDLQLAKNSLINKFVFNFQNSGQIVLQAAQQEMNGFPKDYMATYTQKIGAVTAQDCVKVAQKYLKTDKLTYFVYGPAAKLEADMKAYGTPQVKALPAP